MIWYLAYEKYSLRCVSYLTAFALKCYAGVKVTNERGVQENIVELNCPGALGDSCVKGLLKDGKTEVILKGCSTRRNRESFLMKPDECLHNVGQMCEKYLSAIHRSASRTSPIESPANFTIPNIAIGRNALVQHCKANADRSGQEGASCFCSTDLCNSASNLSHCVISILVTLCIFFII